MRSAQKNNRSRGRGARKGGGGGGGGGGNIVNRVYDSAGPEGKVRGTPQQIIDKYLSLARDAQTTGDRVMSENFLQHAEHYQRLLIQAAVQQEQNRRDHPDGGDYDDDRDSGQAEGREPHGYGQPQHQPHQHQPQQHQPQQRHPQQRRDAEGDGEGEPQGQPQPHAQPQVTDEIGGMTTIDPGRPGGEDLLVATDEVGQSQPRRNGDGRRPRRPRRDRDAAATETAPAPTGPEPVEQEN